MVDEPRGRTVLRRLLGNELRELRESAGKTIQDAANYVRLKPPTISKIENGRQAIRPTNILLLTQFYGVSGTKAAELMQRAEEASKASPWAGYADTMPNWFSRFAELEGDAGELGAYESELVPGLLQTPSYIRAISRAARPSSPEREIDRLVELRIARQDRMLRGTLPKLRFVLNEAVLLRPVGKPDVRKEQFAQLLRLADESAELYVLPFSANVHPSMGVAFTLLGFADPELDFVFLENDRGAVYLEDPRDVERYRDIFEQLVKLALDQGATSAAIARVAKNL